MSLMRLNPLWELWQEFPISDSSSQNGQYKAKQASISSNVMKGKNVKHNTTARASPKKSKIISGLPASNCHDGWDAKLFVCRKACSRAGRTFPVSDYRNRQSRWFILVARY